MYISRKGTEPFPIETVFGMFDGCDIGDKEKWCLQAIINITRRILQTNFLDYTFVGYKRPISSPQKARTNKPAAILELDYRRSDMVPLINNGRFEDFGDTDSDEYR